MLDQKPKDITLKRLGGPKRIVTGRKDWDVKKGEEITFPRRVALDMLQGDPKNWRKVEKESPKPKSKKGEQPKGDEK